VVFPVEKPELRDYVKYVMETMLSDNTQARRLQASGIWERVRPDGRKKRVDAQAILLRGEREPGTRPAKKR